MFEFGTEFFKFLNEHKFNLILTVFILILASDIFFMNIQNNKIDNLNETLTSTINDYKIEYAYNVVAYGLKDDLTDEEVKQQIQEWIELEWGAQIGGLQTICNTDIAYLYALMSEDLAIEVCRSVI